MRRAALATALLVLLGRPASAQSPPEATSASRLSVDASVTVYGDNLEASNPFRTGETLLGTFATAVLDARVNDRLAVRGGAFVHQRFGSDERFDEVRPVLSLIVGRQKSRLVLGTLDTVRRVDGQGPDRTGPHGLLPPLQRETLAFDRPWEAGVQWLVDSERLQQDAWLHWQRRVTPGRRERFDAGMSSRYRLRPALAVRGDIHLVHQGGQVSALEPVADSTAAALGVEAAAPVGRLHRVSLEALAAVSRYVPDRGRPEDARTGFGTFVRLAVEEAGWRLHAILWRAEDFLKVEGDPHYQALRRNGTEHSGVRDYAEAGASRLFTLAPGSWLEASARWHRVENDYEYSFRVIAVARITATLR